MSEARIIYWSGFLIAALITAVMLEVYGWESIVLLGLFAFSLGMSAIGSDAVQREKARSNDS